MIVLQPLHELGKNGMLIKYIAIQYTTVKALTSICEATESHLTLRVGKKVTTCSSLLSIDAILSSQRANTTFCTMCVLGLGLQCVYVCVCACMCAH